MTSKSAPGKQSAIKLSNTQKFDGSNNIDPIITIDKIEKQLKEISTNLDMEQNFYNSFQNSFSHNNIISIEPIEK